MGDTPRQHERLPRDARLQEGGLIPILQQFLAQQIRIARRKIRPPTVGGAKTALGDEGEKGGRDRLVINLGAPCFRRQSAQTAR